MQAIALPLPGTASRWLRPAVVVVLALIGIWLVLQSYQSPASRECLARYRAATTDAEWAAVDALVPDVPGNRGPEAHSCGFTRRTARWRF